MTHKFDATYCEIRTCFAHRYNHCQALETSYACRECPFYKHIRTAHVDLYKSDGKYREFYDTYPLDDKAKHNLYSLKSLLHNYLITLETEEETNEIHGN